MADRKYYVFCDSNCKFESMTKEQIMAAIAEATGNTPTNIDDAFITQLREMNKSGNFKFWVGTTAEYNAIPKKEENVLYITTDDEMPEIIEQMAKEIEELTSETEALSTAHEQLSKVVDTKAKIETGSYIGDGSVSKSITFSFVPKIVFIYRDEVDWRYGITSDSSLDGTTFTFWAVGKTKDVNVYDIGTSDRIFSLVDKTLNITVDTYEPTEDEEEQLAMNEKDKNYFFVAFA